jgi:alpha-beta hydrolase superfamily lysophospholipase
MKVDFTFMYKDGRTPVHATRWIPEAGKCRAVLQIIHGMTEYIERYEPFAEYLAANGILVVGHDHIGHGQSVLSRRDWCYFAPGNPAGILLQDIHQLRRIMQKEYKDVPYFMLGHSMGSFLLRSYLAFRSKGLKGAIIMGTGYTDHRMSQMGIRLTNLLSKVYGWRHRSSLLTGIALGSNKRFDMTGRDPENSWLTKDAEIAGWYYKQPACTFTFTLNGYHALFNTVKHSCLPQNADRIRKNLPLLLVSGADDRQGLPVEGGVGVAVEILTHAGPCGAEGLQAPGALHRDRELLIRGGAGDAVLRERDVRDGRHRGGGLRRQRGDDEGREAETKCLHVRLMLIWSLLLGMPRIPRISRLPSP